MRDTVYSILVINSGVLEYSAIFRNEADAEKDIVRYMRNQYDDLVDDSISSYEELQDLFEVGGDIDLHFRIEPVL
jgi:hypothetical protein